MFFYFPGEYTYHWIKSGRWNWNEFIILVVLPMFLSVGLLRVTRIAWYTLVFGLFILGARDLAFYYSKSVHSSTVFIHLAIFILSVAYFLNPRVRRVYFDPKLRWFRTKNRFDCG